MFAFLENFGQYDATIISQIQNLESTQEVKKMDFISSGHFLE